MDDRAPAELLPRALTLHQAGRLAEAERAYRAILAIAPGHFESMHLLGVIELQRGRFAEAEDLIGRALLLRPDFAPAIYNRANALMEMERIEDALAGYERALALKPDYVEALFNRGNALMRLRRFAQAVASFDRALAIRPDLLPALNNRGDALRLMGQPEAAVASYDRALELDPGYVQALFNRGIALEDRRRLPEALASYDRALALKPDLAAALNNRGNVLSTMQRHAEAAESFARLVAVAPDYDYALGNCLHARLHCCDWAGSDDAVRRVAEAIEQGKRAALPFSFLDISSSPTAQLRCASLFAAHRHPAAPDPLWTGQRYRHDRIRVAYVSADFRAHPVSALIVGVLEGHDAGRFETTALALNQPDDSVLGRRVRAAFARYVDATGKSDRDAAMVLRGIEADIAVDLTGYTQGSRTGIFAHRPAPVQVNYLGFPGTMGAPYIDYIIADRCVIPPAQQPAYSEKVVYLPDSYQANDRRRAVAEHAPTRREAGLPESGFVFCCFNKNYKIVPAVFDRWMRLLQKVPGSVLWLLESNEAAARNLRGEAGRRGVAPERLVFAPKVPSDRHLARHRLADLFLDTLPYNAHTTASDALWAGLPVLTCLGDTFAGRVAGSLLGAAGLPELIAHSLEEYEARALELATAPDRLAATKARLAANRATCALFDTDRTRRNLEAAYAAMWERSQRGEPPAGFSVDAVGPEPRSA